MIRLAAPRLAVLASAATLALLAAAAVLSGPRRRAGAADAGASSLLRPRRDPVASSSSPPRRLATQPMVTCNTTAGIIRVQVHPEWAPIGTQRFLNLVGCGFFDGCAIFRAIPGFVAQFGISPDLAEDSAWKAEGRLQDDPLRPDIPFRTGTMAFGGFGENSRGTQVFFALSDQTGLGKSPWEAPFAQVVGPASFATLKRVQTKYGDNVDQAKLWDRYGYEYLRTNFPGLTYIHWCAVERDRGDEPFVPECPAPSMRSLPEALQALPQAPAIIAERTGVPEPVALITLVAIFGLIGCIFCWPSPSGPQQMVAAPGAGPYPGPPQYQLVR